MSLFIILQNNQCMYTFFAGTIAQMAEQKQNEPNILVCIADGSEDLEAVTIIDVLRRTKAVNVMYSL